MIALTKKKKIVIILAAFLVLAGLAGYFLSGYLKDYFQQKRIISNICKDFDQPVKKINPLAQYVSLWHWGDFLRAKHPLKEYIPVLYWQTYTALNPLARFSSSLHQYETCILLQEQMDRDEAYGLISQDDRQQALISFDLSSIMKEVLVKDDCGLPSTGPNIIKGLREFGKEVKEDEVEKVCDFFHGRGTEAELTAYCGGNEVCLAVLKADQSLIKEQRNAVDERRFSFLLYEAALKNNNAGLCPEPFHIRLFQESVPRIPCRVYFIKDNQNYCDLIYNEIKERFCGA